MEKVDIDDAVKEVKLRVLGAMLMLEENKTIKAYNLLKLALDETDLLIKTNKMEKKIKRVPYISKWYKEEQKDELLHFAFDEQNVGSDWDVDKFSLYDKNLYTYSTNTTNGLWTTDYSKPNVQLKYICNLTQWDLDDLKARLFNIIKHTDYVIKGYYPNDTKLSYQDKKYQLQIIKSYAKDVIDYLLNDRNLRDRSQEEQLKRLEEQAKPKKSYEGTLGEHWKELMDLFELKNNEGLGSLDDFVKSYEICKKRNIEFRVLCIPDDDSKISINKQEDDAHKLYYIYETLGIDFIKDFIKACEKCED